MNNEPLAWMSEKGYQDHPITGNEPTYEDRMNEPKLLANRIITPDGTLLQSYHRHDYKTYIDENGKEYMIDGGLEYQRCNIHDDAPYQDDSVYDIDPHEEIRAAFHWGCRGKDGKSPLEFTHRLLKYMAKGLIKVHDKDGNRLEVYYE